MKRHIIIGAALVACVLAVASCGKISEPELTLTGVDVVGISTDGLEFSLLVDVWNPNDFSAEVSRLEYEIFVDDVKLASGAQREEVDIPGRETAKVRVPFGVTWEGAGKSLDIVVDGEEHEWRLEGSVRARSGALSRAFRFSESGRFNTPEASEIDIDL